MGTSSPSAIAALLTRLHAEMRVAAESHKRLLAMLQPGGDLAMAADVWVLSQVDDRKDWSTEVLGLARELDGKGVDVLSLLGAASDVSPPPVGAVPVPEPGQSPAVSGPVEGEKPRVPAEDGGAPGAPIIGPVEGAVGRAGEFDDVPDPGSEGPFICLVKDMALAVTERNPNFLKGSKHPLRSRRFMVMSQYEPQYAWQRKVLAERGGVLPDGWSLPPETEVTHDGHVIRIGDQ
jgi:hypothetical protein